MGLVLIVNSVLEPWKQNRKVIERDPRNTALHLYELKELSLELFTINQTKLWMGVVARDTK